MILLISILTFLTIYWFLNLMGREFMLGIDETWETYYTKVFRSTKIFSYHLLTIIFALWSAISLYPFLILYYY